MSVVLFINRRGQNIADRYDIATGRSWQQVWLPAARNLQLDLIPEICHGINDYVWELRPQLLQQLAKLHSWMVGAGYAEFARSIDEVIAALATADPEKDEPAFFGRPGPHPRSGPNPGWYLFTFFDQATGRPAIRGPERDFDFCLWIRTQDPSAAAEWGQFLLDDYYQTHLASCSAADLLRATSCRQARLVTDSDEIERIEEEIFILDCDVQERPQLRHADGTTVGQQTDSA